MEESVAGCDSERQRAEYSWRGSESRAHGQEEAGKGDVMEVTWTDE